MTLGSMVGLRARKGVMKGAREGRGPAKMKTDIITGCFELLDLGQSGRGSFFTSILLI